MKAINGNKESNPAIKIATACLLLFLLAGCLFSVVHGIMKVGFNPKNVTVYYLGNEMDNPLSDADDSLTVEEISYPRELPELIESTHVHMFMVPLIYYLLCHLFAQTEIQTKWKITVIALTFGCILVFLASPWLIRYVSYKFAVLVPATDLLFIFLSVTLAGLPLKQILASRQSG